MVVLRLLLLSGGVFLFGFFFRLLVLKDSPSRSFAYFWMSFVSGLGVLSLLLFFTAILGIFRWNFWLAPLLILGAAFLRRRHLASIRNGLIYCVLIALLSSLVYTIARPFEAFLASEDATVYIATAFQLQKAGALTVRDPLLMEMSPAEKQAFTRNRFDLDRTGEFVRFPGGVPILDPDSGEIGFSFYHLFPIWLGFGLQFAGPQLFLCVLSLFFVASAVSLGLLAQFLMSSKAAFFVPIIFSAFYLQQFFSRLPISETLAQTLFLSGLWVWCLALKEANGPNRSNQIVTGLLWGSLFLCRIDASYMLVVCLFLIFSLSSENTLSLSRWKLLVACLGCFCLLTLFHQMQTGGYLYLLGSRIFVKSQPITIIASVLLRLAFELVRHHQIYAVLLLLFLSGAIWIWALRKSPSLLPEKVLRILGATIGLILLISVLWPEKTWWAGPRNTAWFLQYFNPILLAVLVLGVLLFVMDRSQDSVLKHVLLILLVVPAACFLFHPMVFPLQPMAMRRYFPTVLPLFFLLSFAGMQYGIRGLCERRPKMAGPMWVTTWVMIFAVLVGGSLPLIRHPVFSNVRRQTAQLSDAVPPDAVLLIPDTLAAFHLEVPVQFIAGKKALLVKLDFESGSAWYRLVMDYVSRQLANGEKVMVISNNLLSSVDPFQRKFSLKPARSGAISFFRVPNTVEQLPSELESFYFPYSIYSIEFKSPGPNREFVSYDDSGVSFLNFHEKENGFRWTNSESVVCDFAYNTHGHETLMILKTGPNLHQHLTPELMVNDQVSAQFLEKGDDGYHYRVSSTQIPVISSVAIRSPAFIPGGQDTRMLGISFVSLSFHMLQ
jgi:hypothetical protein